jgi:hypothetical protein
MMKRKHVQYKNPGKKMLKMNIIDWLENLL